MVAVLAGGACSSPASFDRSRAVDQVLARAGNAVSRAQAECYVDRVVNELGSSALETTDPDPEKVPRLTSIRIDCVGLASLGTFPPSVSTVTTAGSGLTQARRPGDDPQLDQLHAACGAGNGTACDQLFELAPLGSPYEEFAGTCGGRTREIRCAVAYPGPSIVLATTTSASSTPSPLTTSAIASTTVFTPSRPAP